VHITVSSAMSLNAPHAIEQRASEVMSALGIEALYHHLEEEAEKYDERASLSDSSDATSVFGLNVLFDNEGDGEQGTYIATMTSGSGDTFAENDNKIPVGIITITPKEPEVCSKKSVAWFREQRMIKQQELSRKTETIMANDEHVARPTTPKRKASFSATDITASETREDAPDPKLVRPSQRRTAGRRMKVWFLGGPSNAKVNVVPEEPRPPPQIPVHPPEALPMAEMKAESARGKTKRLKFVSKTVLRAFISFITTVIDKTPFHNAVYENRLSRRSESWTKDTSTAHVAYFLKKFLTWDTSGGA